MASKRPPPPARINIVQINVVRVELYLQVPPPGDKIPVKTYPFAINDNILLMDKIEWSVCCLRCHRSGGTSNIRAEHLQYWLVGEKREERLDTENWDRVVEILQTYFWYDRLPTECTWQTVVIIPKGGGDFRGIRLIELLWKSLSGVIHRRIGAAVQFHDMLHGFWEGRGAGTAYIESKLLQQLTEMRG